MSGGQANQVPSVHLGGQDYRIRRSWDGQSLNGKRLAIDTETEVIEGLDVPRLAIAAVHAGGNEVVLVAPDQLADFILTHHDRRWVMHHCAFDVWGVNRALDEAGRDDARNAWWAMIDSGRLDDTMILDMLLRLAREDTYPESRNLADLAIEYAGISEIDKSDPWRLRYGELIGVPATDWPSEAIEYAAGDPVATYRIHRAQRNQALELAARHGIAAEVIDRWGPLSAQIQAKASIGFASVERTGLGIDDGQLQTLRRALTTEVESAITALQADPISQGLFRLDRTTGELLRTDSGIPRIAVKRLREILGEIAATIEVDAGHPVDVPHTAGGELVTSIHAWEDYLRLSSFLTHWASLGELAKLLGFFGRLEGRGRVFPRYKTMVRTGRTSCSGPNLQQIPRRKGMREAFVPSPGHLLLQVDYRFIELVTLAAVCEHRYGVSALAKVIRNGIDPHVYSAALVNGMTIDEFEALRDSDPTKYKLDRQSAKPLNFGIPGGLGASSLARYAHRAYGIPMTTEQAAELREKVITLVYPEWSTYLQENSWELLAGTLGTGVPDLVESTCYGGSNNPRLASAIRNICGGRPHKKDGTPTPFKVAKR